MIKPLTYDEILKSMKDEFKIQSGCNADDASDVGIKLRVLAGQLYSLSTQMDFVCKQLFLSTATGEYLDNHARARGLTRRKETKAHGVARFFCEDVAQTDILIPKQTRCAILMENSEIYETTKKAIIKQGESFVDVDIVAVKGGESANAVTGVITTLINPPSLVKSVTNITELTGGSEKESDENLRKRIAQSLKIVSNGANKEFYSEIALEHPKVISANIVDCARGAGTVDVVVETSEQKENDNNSIISQLNTVLNEKREIGTDVKAFLCENLPIDINAHLKIDSFFDSQSVIDSCKLKISNYIGSLKVGENLKVAEISNILYNEQGVLNYKIETPTDDTSIAGRCKLKIRNLNVLSAM